VKFGTKLKNSYLFYFIIDFNVERKIDGLLNLFVNITRGMASRRRKVGLLFGAKYWNSQKFELCV